MSDKEHLIQVYTFYQFWLTEVKHGQLAMQAGDAKRKGRAVLTFMLKESYRDKVTDEEVLKRTQKTTLMSDIRKRQPMFSGHVMRRSAMQQLVTIDKREGKRSKSKQREGLLDKLTAWLIFSCFHFSLGVTCVAGSNNYNNSLMCITTSMIVKG